MKTIFIFLVLMMSYLHGYSSTPNFEVNNITITNSEIPTSQSEFGALFVQEESNNAYNIGCAVYFEIHIIKLRGDLNLESIYMKPDGYWWESVFGYTNYFKAKQCPSAPYKFEFTILKNSFNPGASSDYKVKYRYHSKPWRVSEQDWKYSDEFTIAIEGPAITGSYPLCASNTTYNVSNYPSQVNYLSWNYSSNINMQSSTGFSAIFRAASNNSSQYGYIEPKYIFNSGFELTCKRHNLWLGQPLCNLIGEDEIMIGAPGIVLVDYINESDFAKQGIDNINWSYTGPITGFTGGLTKAEFRAGTRPGYGYIDANVINECGNYSDRFNYEVIDFYLSVSPNPASNYINVIVNDKSFKSLIDKNSANNNVPLIRIYDNYGQVIMEYKLDKSNLEINTSNLKEGIYIIEFVSSNYKEQHTIVVNH